jgi:hypothetical protein
MNFSCFELNYIIYYYFLISFLVEVVLTTVLTVVSFFTLSSLMIVSFLSVSTVFATESVLAESVLPESAEEPLLWPLQAANDAEIASANAVIFNVFFMVIIVLMFT